MIKFTNFSSFSRSLCTLISKMVLSISGVSLFLSLFSIAILLCVNKKMKLIICFIFKTTLKRESTFQCCSQRVAFGVQMLNTQFGIIMFWARPFAFLPTLNSQRKKCKRVGLSATSLRSVALHCGLSASIPHANRNAKTIQLKNFLKTCHIITFEIV